MPPVVSIVGKSESGKTTLLEKLIPELKNRGYRIAIIKHAHHGFEIDKKGKDSVRHKNAGADAVMVAGKGKIAIVKDEPRESLHHLVSYFEDMDVVLSEGYKSDIAPKIEVFRKEMHEHPACLDDPLLIAFVSDTEKSERVPNFNLNEVEGLADFIESKFLKN